MSSTAKRQNLPSWLRGIQVLGNRVYPAMVEDPGSGPVLRQRLSGIFALSMLVLVPGATALRAFGGTAPRIDLVLGYVAGLGAVLLVLRRTRRIDVAVHLACALTATVLAVMASLAAGPADDILLWLPLIPTLAAITGPAHAGSLWGVLTAGLAVGLWWSTAADPGPSGADALRSHALGLAALSLVIGVVLDLNANAWRRSRMEAHRSRVRLQRQTEERRRAERGRDEAREQYERLVELLPEAVLVHTNGILRYCNARAVELIGARRADEVLGRALVDFVHPGDRTLVQGRVAELHSSGSLVPPAEWRLVRVDGRSVEVEAEGSAISLAGETSVQVILRDVEGRKGIEESLRRSAVELEQKNRELREAHDATMEAIELKSRFLANLSHEIRTPMNAVIGMTQVLSETDLDREQSDYLETLSRSAHALMQLLDDILDLSKFESGRFELRITEYSVRQLLVDVDALIRPRARSRGLRLAVRVDDAVPPRQRGDVDRLRQIVLNLVSNALKFTESGSIEVRATYDAAFDRIRIEVEDSGIGIEPEQCERVFDSFTQADGSATRRHGGAGLGLSIVRRLVERMDGAIGVESEPGRGSTFWIELPVSSAEPSESVLG